MKKIEVDMWIARDPNSGEVYLHPDKPWKHTIQREVKESFWGSSKTKYHIPLSLIENRHVSSRKPKRILITIERID